MEGAYRLGQETLAALQQDNEDVDLAEVGDGLSTGGMLPHGSLLPIRQC